MKYRVIIEAPAWHDIDEAYAWLKQRVPEHAVRWFNSLQDAVLGLSPFSTSRWAGWRKRSQIASAVVAPRNVAPLSRRATHPPDGVELRKAGMPICIDIYDITGASADEIAHAHVKGRSLRDQYGGSYVRYLLNESREEVFAGRDEVEHLGDGLMAVFVSAEGFLQPGRAHAVAAEA